MLELVMRALDPRQKPAFGVEHLDDLLAVHSGYCTHQSVIVNTIPTEESRQTHPLCRGVPGPDDPLLATRFDIVLADATGNATTGTWQLIYGIAQRFTLRAQSGLDNSLDVIWVWRFQEAQADAGMRRFVVVPP